MTALPACFARQQALSSQIPRLVIERGAGGPDKSVVSTFPTPLPLRVVWDQNRAVQGEPLARICAERSPNLAKNVSRTGDRFALWNASVRSIVGCSPARDRLTTDGGR